MHSIDMKPNNCAKPVHKDKLFADPKPIEGAILSSISLFESCSPTVSTQLQMAGDRSWLIWLQRLIFQVGTNVIQGQATDLNLSVEQFTERCDLLSNAIAVVDKFPGTQ